MQISNFFKNIPGNLPEELFEVLIENSQLKIERIVSKGHSSPTKGWYDQVTNEWVIVLQGNAVLGFEDKEVSLEQGDYVNIPAHTKHKVLRSSADPETIWLAIHY